MNKLSRIVMTEKYDSSPFEFTRKGCIRCGKFIRGVGGIEVIFGETKPWFSIGTPYIIDRVNKFRDSLKKKN